MSPIKKEHTETTNKIQLTADVYNIQGEVSSTIQLPAYIFAAKINPYLMSQAVRVYLANQRSGTAATKTRAQVVGSTRKIYRQKGTGKARHGDLKAPIFIGGGVAHGPHPRNFSLSISQKMKFRALCSALSDAYRQGKIKLIEGIDTIESKTKQLITVFERLAIAKNQKLLKKTLLVWGQRHNNILLAARNIQQLQPKGSNLINAYDVLMHANILITTDAIEQLEKTNVDNDNTVTQKRKNFIAPEDQQNKKKSPVKASKKKKEPKSTKKVTKKSRTKKA